MTNQNEEQSKLSEEEKREKQEEIAKRLAEIKNKLTSQPGKKTPKPARPVSESTAPIEKAQPKITDIIQDMAKDPARPSGKDVKKEVLSPKREIQFPLPADQPEKKAAPKNPANAPLIKQAELEKTGDPSSKKWSGNQLKGKGNIPRKNEQKKTGEIEIRPLTNSLRKKRIKWLAFTGILLAIAACWFWLVPVTGEENTVPGDHAAGTLPAHAPAGKETSDEKRTDEGTHLSASAGKKEEAVASTKTTPKELTSPKGTKNDKWGLVRPCFVISYLATKDEQKAISMVQSLSSKGFSAGYYWIPDYLSSGPSLYKVYIGPFVSKNEAAQILPSINKLKPDAYIQKVNA